MNNRLARLIAKYGLVAEAAPEDALPLSLLVAEIKKDLIGNYQRWVIGDKYRALKILAEANIPEVKELYDMYNDLIANIDYYSATQLFNRVEKIRTFIREMKEDPKKSYRNNIHDSVKVHRESDRNYREHLKSGFETNLLNISTGLSNVSKKLKALVPDIKTEVGDFSPTRKALSKEQLLMFVRSPVSQLYGLDDLDVVEKLLSYPETREKITTLINAVKRGHVPRNGAEVAQEAADYRKVLQDHATTNAPYFGTSEEAAQSATQALEDPAEQWSHNMLKRKEERELEKQEESESFPETASQIQRRDQQHQNKQEQQAEEDLIAKYNKLTFDQWMRRVS
jgi:hypothetical protein